MSVEEREAEPYDEIKVLQNIIPQGHNVLLAHLKHLIDHNQTDYYQQAVAYLEAQKIPVDTSAVTQAPQPALRQCPGSQAVAFNTGTAKDDSGTPSHSHLSHWPIQLHLISPSAPHYQNSDLLIAADCVAYAHADFHRDFLKSHTLAIACPKLDANQEIYRDKLLSLIDEAQVKSIRVMIMQVPCCRGLLQQVVEAANSAKRQIPVSCVTVGIQGQILREDPIETGLVRAAGS
jgi:hypothetical protein